MRRTIARGENRPVHAAASSMASGRPSSRRQTSATAGASLASTLRKCPWSRARSRNSRVAGCRLDVFASHRARQAVQPELVLLGQARGRRGSSSGPGGTGHPRAAARSGRSSRRCSRLSSTRTLGSPPRRSMTAVSRSSLADSPVPIRVAMASRIPAPVVTGARSTNATEVAGTFEPPRDLTGEPGLADAAEPGDRDQPMGQERGLELCELLPAPDQGVALVHEASAYLQEVMVTRRWRRPVRGQQNARRNFRPDPVSVDASTVGSVFSSAAPSGKTNHTGQAAGATTALSTSLRVRSRPHRSCPQRVHERAPDAEVYRESVAGSDCSSGHASRIGEQRQPRRVRPERLAAGDPPRLVVDPLDQRRPRRDQQPGRDPEQGPSSRRARRDLSGEGAGHTRHRRSPTPRCRPRRPRPRAARRRAGSRPPRWRCRGACRRPRGAASGARPASTARGG